VRGNTNGISLQRGEKMLVMTANFEKNIVDKIRKLSEIQKLELLNYIESLNEKFKRFEGPKGLNRALRGGVYFGVMCFCRCLKALIEP
jgi:hypothetical protein